MPKSKLNHSVTIKDVAEHAGVSLATASRVLNNTGYVSKETRSRVQKAVRTLGYKPNELARNLKKRRSDTIGLMITDIINPFYSYLADGVLDCARKLGYHVVLCATDEDAHLEKEYLVVLMHQRAAGIIAVPTGENVKIWCEAHDLGVKMVLVDREIPDLPETDVVLVDNVKGAYEATKHLIELGHKRIAIVNGPITTTTGKGRLEGYQRAMQDANIPLVSEYIEQVSFKGESGKAAAKRLLSLPNPPTAIFATNNVLGEAVFTEINAAGLRIPEDISLVLFDDVPWASLVNPPITVVSQPTYQLGYLSMELVHRQLQQEKDDSPVTPQKSLLKPALIIRKSCIAPKKLD